MPARVGVLVGYGLVTSEAVMVAGEAVESAGVVARVMVAGGVVRGAVGGRILSGAIVIKGGRLVPSLIGSSPGPSGSFPPAEAHVGEGEAGPAEEGPPKEATRGSTEVDPITTQPGPAG